MATAVPMDYSLPYAQGNSFQILFGERDVRMLAMCAVYAIAYASNLQKHRTYLKF